METKNLVIRESTFEDCELFARWEKEPEVRDSFSIDDERGYKETVTEFVLNGRDESRLDYMIVLKSDSHPIGRLCIAGIDEETDSLNLKMIYIADTDNRGKGYGKEAIISVLEHCFIVLHRERVTARYFATNAAAHSFFSGLGFQSEGVARNACKKNGKYFDLEIMSMLRTEFFDNIHTK